MKKDFSPLRHLPQMGDAILIHDDRGGILSDGIEWFENGRCSHVEIYVGSGEGKTIGARIDGVRCHSLSEYYKDHYTVTVRRIKNIRLDQAARMKETAYGMVAKKWAYGFTSYLGFVAFRILHKVGVDLMWLPNPTNLPGMPVCSGVWDLCARSAHADCFPHIGMGCVTPQDIMESEHLETIIEI